MLVPLIAVSVATIAVALPILALTLRHKPQEKEYTTDFTEWLKENRLEYGIYFFEGEQGAGKSSLMYALMSMDYLYHNDERVELARAKIEEINANSKTPYNVTIPPIAYRTKTDLTFPDGKKAYQMDISEYGIPGLGHEVQYLPYSTVVAFDDVNDFIDNREWTKPKKHIVSAWRFCRHIENTCLIDSQNLEIDKKLKGLITHRVFVESRRPVFKTVRKGFKMYDKFIGYEWKFNLTKLQSANNAIKQNQMYGASIDVSQFTKTCKFFYPYDIHEQFDSFGALAYWMNGLEDYEVKEHPDTSFSREGFEQYCETNKLVYNPKETKQEDDDVA